MDDICSGVCYALKQFLLCFFLLAVFAPKTGYTRMTSAVPYQAVVPSPEFEQILSREMDTYVGETVMLPCTVRALGDKTVSWIRKRDLHILTSGPFTYTSDSRFEVVHEYEEPNFWGLRIRGVRMTDTGQYECQVNTDPKMNQALNLTVRGLPRGNVAHIRGPREQYVREGSTVTFLCEVTQQGFVSSGVHRLSATRAHVRWAHDKTELSAQSSRRGISIDTEYRDRQITSKLTLTAVTQQDGGFYTCSQSNSRSATVSLIVVEAEHSEAMQRDEADSGGQDRGPFKDHIFLCCFYVLCIYINVQ